MSEYILTEREKHLIDMANDSVATLIEAFPKVLLRLDNLELRLPEKIPYDHPFNAKTTYDIDEHLKTLELENKDLRDVNQSLRDFVNSPGEYAIKSSKAHQELVTKYCDLMDKYGKLLEKQA